jgi:hypothetical protein
MSLFGKVLAVLNLLALGGFLYMATVTLQARQAWSYAVMRWDIALDGMPVDEDDSDERGKPKYLNLNEGLCQELTGSSDTATQEAYLMRRKEELVRKVNESAAKDKIVNLTALLVPLMQTAGEREALIACRTDANPGAKFKEGLLQVLSTRLDVYKKAARPDPRLDGVQKLLDEVKSKEPVDAGLAVFDAHFEEVKNSRDPQNKGKDREAKRLAIAATLISLSDALSAQKAADPTAEPAYQQAANVVGVRMLSRALDILARNGQAMAIAAGDNRTRERFLFAAQHQSLINQLLDREHKLFEQQAKVKAVEAQVKELETKADQQEREVKAKEDVLKTLRDETRKEFERLSHEQERLYKYRLLLRDANRKNQEAEEQIRRFEAQLKDE